MLLQNIVRKRLYASVISKSCGNCSIPDSRLALLIVRRKKNFAPIKIMGNYHYPLMKIPMIFIGAKFFFLLTISKATLESGINVPPWINVAPGTFGKNNRRSPLLNGRWFDSFIHSQRKRKLKILKTFFKNQYTVWL